MYLNGAGFMMRAGQQGIRARFADATSAIICREVGQVKSRTRDNSGQTASKRGEILLNFLSGCANIVRASCGRICHYSDMASPKQSISPLSDPMASPFPE